MLAETVADTDGQTLGILKYKMLCNLPDRLPVSKKTYYALNGTLTQSRLIH